MFKHSDIFIYPVTIHRSCGNFIEIFTPIYFLEFAKDGRMGWLWLAAETGASKWLY